MSVHLDGPLMTEHIGYQPEFTIVGSARRRLRNMMDSLVFEVVVIMLVLCYAVVLFVDMTSGEGNQVDKIECQLAGPTPAYVLKYNASLVRTCNLEQEKNALYYLDLIFLSIFIFEIMLRLLGYGLSFLRDPLQAIDFVVVTIAFITRVLPDSVRRPTTAAPPPQHSRPTTAPTPHHSSDSGFANGRLALSLARWRGGRRRRPSFARTTSSAALPRVASGGFGWPPVFARPTSSAALPRVASGGLRWPVTLSSHQPLPPPVGRPSPGGRARVEDGSVLLTCAEDGSVVLTALAAARGCWSWQVMAGSGNMINLLRVIRLFRLAVVLQRLQRSRDVRHLLTYLLTY
jgi:hypothetical protein